MIKEQSLIYLSLTSSVVSVVILLRHIILDFLWGNILILCTAITAGVKQE